VHSAIFFTAAQAGAMVSGTPFPRWHHANIPSGAITSTILAEIFSIVEWFRSTNAYSISPGTGTLHGPPARVLTNASHGSRETRDFPAPLASNDCLVAKVASIKPSRAVLLRGCTGRKRFFADAAGAQDYRYRRRDRTRRCARSASKRWRSFRRGLGKAGKSFGRGHRALRKARGGDSYVRNRR